MEGLKSHTKLQNLWLRSCDLSTKSGPILRDLKNIINLEELVLSLNSIGDEGLEGLMEGLTSHTNLRYLVLRSCDLSTKSGPILKDLKNIINLEELVLSGNPIGDEGLQGLMEGLKSQTKLRFLRLNGCKLSTKSGPVLRDLKNIINLEDLVLNGCRLSKKSGPVLRDLKKRNKLEILKAIGNDPRVEYFLDDSTTILR
uniref:Uncharacterized protein n=1 Tax=Eptatretus burgeri TaxID=7764 RepID=A0A8C4N330_EPTBU